MICPKCGHQQGSGDECRRCGIVFERYRVVQERMEQTRADTGTVPRAGLFRRFYRVFRWVGLAGTVLVLLLILRQPAPPRLRSDPAAPQRLDAKLREMDTAARSGKPYSLRMGEAELNTWLGSNLALSRERGSGDPAPVSSANPTTEVSSAGESGEQTTPVDGQTAASVEEVQSSVRDVRIALNDDVLRAFVLFDFHGKELALVLEGRLFVESGYLRLQPSHMQLGSLPIPGTVVENAVRRLFTSPENREKFRLPPGIADIRVANSELIVTRK